MSQNKSDAALNALLLVVLGAATGAGLLVLSAIVGEAKALAAGLCMLVAWTALYFAWTR